MNTGEPVARAVERLKGRDWLLLLMIELTVLLPSIYVVLNYTGGEPFFVARKLDVWIQVGLAAALIILRIELTVLTAFLLKRHREQRWQLASLLLWSLFALFWIVEAPRQYVEDIVRHSAEDAARAYPGVSR